MALLTLNSVIFMMKLLLWAKGKGAFPFLKEETKSPRNGIKMQSLITFFF